jgi:predicted RNase H-like HicB family nuclease
MNYIAYLHKDQKSVYGVSFPDLPGCVTSGRTLDEARSNATEALPLNLQNMAEDNETIPEPSTIYDIGVADDPAMKDAVALLIVKADLKTTGRHRSARRKRL